MLPRPAQVRPAALRQRLVDLNLALDVGPPVLTFFETPIFLPNKISCKDNNRPRVCFGFFRAAHLLIVTPNRPLAALPDPLLSLLDAHCSPASLSEGAIVRQAGEKIEHIHFPHQGIVSVQTPLLGGRFIDTSLIGRDGVLGAMAALGRCKTRARFVVGSALVSNRI